MNSVKEILFGPDAERAERIARGIVEKGFPEGSSIWCEKCGLDQDLTQEETIEFLLNGRECCGQRMKL